MNEELKARLLKLGLTEDQIKKLETEGATTEADITLLTADNIKSTTGCGIIFAIKVAADFKPKDPVIEKPVETTTTITTPSLDVLPQVPDDNSFVSMLKIGGELKVGTTEVIAAIRAALADQSGLYGLPKIIMARMEKFAEEQEEPCSKDYYELQKLVTRHSYAEIFAALDLDSASVTQAKKDNLLRRLAKDLWPALQGFNQQVVNWVEAWQKGAMNPNAMMMMMMGGGQGAMPAGMMQPPSTDVLRDAAESVNNNVNRVFAGTGIVIARALALDANRVKEVLSNPTLPSQIGATNHDQMLKMLEVNVSADYVRLENNITRYALAIMEFPKIPAGTAELSYLNALFQLGTQIPWEKLSKEDRPEGGNTFRSNK